MQLMFSRQRFSDCAKHFFKILVCDVPFDFLDHYERLSAVLIN